MKRYDLKFIAFCRMFADEMNKILKEENLTLNQAKEKFPEFIPWYELIEMVQDVVKTYNHINTDSVWNDLKRVTREMDKILFEGEIEYYPVVLYFNMLQNCKFSYLRYDGSVIDKLKDFDYKSLYPLIDKHNLRNGIKCLRASLVFKKRYWENYE